jgi:hypothetical protein
MDMTKSAFQIAHFQVAGISAGVSGFSRWDAYRAKYDGGVQDYSVIGAPNEGFKLRPHYYLHQLIAAATVPGSDILKVQPVPGNLVNKMAALRAPDGKTTFLMSHYVNKARTFIVDGLAPGKEYNLNCWNKAGDGRNTAEGTVTVDKWGRLTLTVGAEVLAVVTEAPIGADIFK